MVALVSTVAYLGLEARGVEVQCQIAPGLPRFNVVGLPDKAVKESQEREGNRAQLAVASTAARFVAFLVACNTTVAARLAFVTDFAACLSQSRSTEGNIAANGPNSE